MSKLKRIWVWVNHDWEGDTYIHIASTKKLCKAYRAKHQKKWGKNMYSEAVIESLEVDSEEV